MTQRVEVFFSIWREELNLSCFPIWLKELIFKMLKELNLSSIWFTYFFTWLGLNSFLINTTQRVEFFTKNDSKCWTPFWIWLKELNFFCIGLKELNFFQYVSKNWAFFKIWVQKWKFFWKNNPIPKNDSKNWTPFCLFQQWLKELNSL